MHPTLSVLCPTRHPGPLVARCLAPFRSAATEIIVAADDRVGDDDLAHYATVATELVRFEFCGPNRHWPWLASRTSGEWLLIIDGDETPSLALLEEIPRHLSRRDVRELSLPIHWLFGDPATRVVSEPIGSDRRSLLVRNDAQVRFGARRHEIEVSAGPIAYLDAPVYHLGLLLMGREERERKVAEYEADRPGLLAADGTSFNRGLYLPEDGAMRTEPVPAADAVRLAAALGASDIDAPRIAAGSLVHARREEIERAAGIGDPAPMVIECGDPPPPLIAESPARRWWVRVTNGSQVAWQQHAGARPCVNIGVRWRDESGAQVGEGRASLPHALAPGCETLVPITLTPPRPGRLTLELDGIEEGVRWFGDPVAFEVEAAASPRSLIDDLAAEGGGHVALDGVLVVRRWSGAIDGLADLVPARSGHVRVLDLCGEMRSRSILQFGAGPLTAALAALLAENSSEVGQPRLLVVDHDAAALASVAASLGELDRLVQPVLRPLVEAPGRPPFYELDDDLRAAIGAVDPALVIVAAPRRDDRASTRDALDFVREAALGAVRVLLLDALTDANLGVAARWSERDDVTIHGIDRDGAIFDLLLQPLS